MSFFKRLFKNKSEHRSQPEHVANETAVQLATKDACEAAEKVWNKGWKEKFPDSGLSDDGKLINEMNRDHQLAIVTLKRNVRSEVERVVLHSEAERYVRRAAAIAEKVQHHGVRCYAFHWLGDLLFRVSRDFLLGESWLRRAAKEADLMTASERNSYERTRHKLFNDLAEVLHLQGKHEEAKEWEKRSAAE